MPKKKRMATDALKFLGTILVLSGFSYGALIFTPLESALGGYTAYATQAVLASLGEKTVLVLDAFPHLVGPRFDAELIPLCFGTLEIALWTGIVFATENRSLKRRFQGFLAGLATFLAFNPVRIALTLYVFDASEPFASFAAHDVLFRLTLVALFVVAYAVWYAWPEQRKTPRK
ncbi:exosortase/archaeosortase family protein [Candidatus Micrarchaeota archaeon]|nr:exosortase/archaeosortase family protein [Candidatus Micrarchaeota archaeon]